MVAVKLLTPDVVEAMYDRGEIDDEINDFELVDGEIVWMTKPSDPAHSLVAALIIRVLGPWADLIGAWLMSESYLYRTTAERKNLRSPDVALTTKERMSLFPEPKGWGTDAPDLCVEILSSRQYGESYARPKVKEYLDAGAKVVWLVDTQKRTVRAFESGSDEVRTYSGDDEINLDRIAPGFGSPIGAFFPPR